MPTNINEIPPCESCSTCVDSVFAFLSKENLMDLSKHKTTKFYKKGQIIFEEGSHPQGLYCIHKGKVKISKLGPDGREQIVRLAKPGNLLGYRALLSDDKYFASAVTLEDSLVCFYSRTYYMDLINKNPQLSMETIKVLAADLRLAEKMILNMAQKHVRRRMAETLLLLSEYYGLDADQQTINTVLKREDIGNIAGTTTETSIRVLSDFNKENIIKLSGKRIKILNFKELTKLAST